jgi:hypothetical protein
MILALSTSQIRILATTPSFRSYSMPTMDRSRQYCHECSADRESVPQHICSDRRLQTSASKRSATGLDSRPILALAILVESVRYRECQSTDIRANIECAVPIEKAYLILSPVHINQIHKSDLQLTEQHLFACVS